MKPLCLIPLALSLLGLSACGPNLRATQSVQPKLLFSLEYGLQDRMIGLPEGRARDVELFMREGIFHILDPVSEKILRTSSYGDLLSTLYDPETAPQPSFNHVRANADKGSDSEPSGSGGRYAAATSFVHPSRISVDSAQRIYVADRLSDSEAAVFDPLTGSYYDWIIRRFGENGRELQFLGREGALGSAFPKILSIDCLSDDSIVAVSTSGSLYTVYRYSSDARLLSSFGIDSASLPVPLDLVDSTQDAASAGKIHADLEAIIPQKSASGFDVILKLNYYREAFNPNASVKTGPEDSGSWIFSMDGRTGSQNFGFRLEQSESASLEWELIGVYKEGFLLVSQQTRLREATGETGPGLPDQEERRKLRFVDHSGKTLSSAEIRIPGEGGLLRPLRLSSTGQLYGIVLGSDDAKILWWELPF